MLPDYVTTPLLYLQDSLFHPPDDVQSNVTMALRWFHIIAGIVWIGHLYFFNLVNVNLMKSLDGATKGKVIPQLMPRALWWFRWGAVVTVLVGLTYFAMYILPPDARNAGANSWLILLVWLLIVIAAFVLMFFILRTVDKGWIVGVLIGVVASVMAVAVTAWLNSSLTTFASSRTLSIGIGGGLGTIMLFNVWGIIWPNQKRIIAWTANNAEKGTAVPAASARLARVAFLASRANTWLSVPMLFFMAASGTHYPLLGR
ncbi:MAG TPA: urate hydroxylase PuuD [Blastocatellia bacterium]|nr:urate hydroxylase PuuD [Blastocatellia bacterium]